MSRDHDESVGDVPSRPYSLSARVSLSHPDLPLMPTLDAAPRIRVRPQSLLPGSDRFFFTGFGDDLAAFEDGLAADPTVAEPLLIGEHEDGRVYRGELTERSRVGLRPFDASEAYVRAAKGTRDEWTVRLSLPGRDALVRFTRGCREAGLELEIERIGETGDETSHRFGLGAEQERILRLAYEAGYFEVPRGVSQTELANSLDLSTSAVSQHLRRATAELVANTLLSRRKS